MKDISTQLEHFSTVADLLGHGWRRKTAHRLKIDVLFKFSRVERVVRNTLGIISLTYWGQYWQSVRCNSCLQKFCARKSTWNYQMIIFLAIVRIGNSTWMVTTISPSTFLSAIKEAVAAKAIRQVGQERFSGEKIMMEKLEGIFLEKVRW